MYVYKNSVVLIPRICRAPCFSLTHTHKDTHPQTQTQTQTQTVYPNARPFRGHDPRIFLRFFFMYSPLAERAEGKRCIQTIRFSRDLKKKWKLGGVLREMHTHPLCRKLKKKRGKRNSTPESLWGGAEGEGNEKMHSLF
jgi:hypothetical protein